MYYVYMLRCNDGSLYTGITNNLEKRLEMHKGNLPGGAKYTRAKGAGEFEAVFEVENRSEASKLEYRIKHMTKKQKEDVLRSAKGENE